VLDAKGGRGVSLGIQIDHDHPQPVHGQRRRDVDDTRRLSDAALLVRDRDDPGCLWPRPGAGVIIENGGRAVCLGRDGRVERCFT
jgi:hypothetical protein